MLREYDTIVKRENHFDESDSVKVVINFSMTGDPYQNDQGYQTVSSLLLPRNATRVITNAYPKDPSYPPGMKCKRTGILRSEEIAVRAIFFWRRDIYQLFPNSKRDYLNKNYLQPGEEELHCLCPDSLCNEHVGEKYFQF